VPLKITKVPTESHLRAGSAEAGMRPKPSSYQEETQRWVETEFESADLGDGRLNKAA
jgi:hypothetical protein